MAGETGIPSGYVASIPLVKVDPDIGPTRFQPLEGAESSTGTIALREFLEAPSRFDEPEFRTAVTGQNLGSTSRSGSLPTYGLATMAQQYAADPENSNNFRRGTGGLVFGAGTGADAVLTNRQAPDVRSFLYGFNVAGGDAKPALINDAGELVVTTTATVPGTITTAADQATAAGSNTSVAAANSSRRQVIIQNVDATDAVRVGDTNITATRGIRLAAGESVTLEVTAQIFARAEAGTPSVAVTQIQ